MIAYHTIATDSVKKALQHGLKRTSRGEKGNDPSIMQTDKYLDTHRPKNLVTAQVSRDDNLYAYVANEGNIINIADGTKTPLRHFIDQEDQAVLELTIDEPARCFVSDLDLFDTAKTAIENDTDEHTLRELAERYWQNLIPLQAFSMNDIRRPEIMIPYDIPPNKIRMME